MHAYLLQQLQWGNALAEVRNALATVFKSWTLELAAIAVALFTALAFVLVPVLTIPGNDLSFYFEITPWWTYAMLAFFSIGLGVLAAMQLYLLQQPVAVKEKVGGFAGVFSGVTSGLYATAACGACVSTLFSFLGAGTTLFLNVHRTPLLGVSVLVLATAIYYNARKVNKHCSECRI